MLAIEKEIHNCKRCRELAAVNFPYPPVYSFGNPSGKKIILVGINPSVKEFEGNFLLDKEDVRERRHSQLHYFDKEPYNYFKKVTPFLEGPVKEKLGWKESPWERVGVLDLVKCATVKRGGQWNKLTKTQKQFIIKNCEDYLIQQLKLYLPKFFILYGVGVCEWFQGFLDIEYEKYETFQTIFCNEPVRGIFIPQRQGYHSKPEILWVQDKLQKMLVTSQ